MFVQDPWMKKREKLLYANNLDIKRRGGTFNIWKKWIFKKAQKDAGNSEEAWFVYFLIL